MASGICAGEFPLGGKLAFFFLVFRDAAAEVTWSVLCYCHLPLGGAFTDLRIL